MINKFIFEEIMSDYFSAESLINWIVNKIEKHGEKYIIIVALIIGIIATIIIKNK